MRTQRTAQVVTALALAIAPVSEARDEPVRPMEFWRAIVDNQYAVPDGEDAFELLDDLFDNLGSTDPILRDDFGYGITAHWLLRQRLLEEDDLLILVEKLEANLEEQIGAHGDDSVLLRSFSALNLSIFAARDLEQPFLSVDDFESLLDASLSYLDEERDLRGWDPDRGWLHSAAHTADLLRELGRNPRLDATGAERIFTAVARRLTTAGLVFTHGEDERLARALLSLLARDDFEVRQLDSFLDTLRQGKARPPGATTFDPMQHSARQNGVHLLRVLFVTLARQPQLSERLLGARSRILNELASF